MQYGADIHHGSASCAFYSHFYLSFPCPGALCSNIPLTVKDVIIKYRGHYLVDSRLLHVHYLQRPYSKAQVPPGMSQSWFEESLNAMATASTNNPQTSMSPYPRRKRPINSCTECRRRKAGCSKSYPCTNCIKFSRHCVFDPHGRSTDQDLFKHAAPGRTASDDESYAASPSWSAESGQSEHSQDTSNVQGTPAMNEEGQLSSNDGRHNVGKLEMDNFCLHVGKLSLNGRIGGALRPKITSIVRNILIFNCILYLTKHI